MITESLDLEDFINAMKNNREIILIHNGARYKSRKIVELLYGKKQTNSIGGLNIQMNYIEIYDYVSRIMGHDIFISF